MNTATFDSTGTLTASSSSSSSTSTGGAGTGGASTGGGSVTVPNDLTPNSVTVAPIGGDATASAITQNGTGGATVFKSDPSGNVTVAGTLGVTGQSTLNVVRMNGNCAAYGYMHVTGNTVVTTAQATGLVSAAGLTLTSGQLTFVDGSTLASAPAPQLSFFQMDGQFWTSSSTTSRYKWCISLHNTQNAANDQLDMAFVMPYAGALRKVIVIQNGGTTQTGNIFIQRAPAVAAGTALTFSDMVSLPSFIKVVAGYQTCVQTYAQNDPTVQLAAGDTIKADIQYNGTGVNQSSIIELIFAAPGVT